MCTGSTIQLYIVIIVVVGVYRLHNTVIYCYNSGVGVYRLHNTVIYCYNSGGWSVPAPQYSYILL